MQTIRTIGLDIAKSIFQVHGVDAAGNVIVRRKLKRPRDRTLTDYAGILNLTNGWSHVRCPLAGGARLAAAPVRRALAMKFSLGGDVMRLVVLASDRQDPDDGTPEVTA